MNNSYTLSVAGLKRELPLFKVNDNLQIAAFILPLCERNRHDVPSFCAEFLAEALINWSMDGAEFDVIYPILEKVIQK